VALFTPHIVWQLHNKWPTLEFMRNATSYKLTTKSPLAFLGEQVLIMHPFLVPFWLAGLAYYFVDKEGRAFQLLGWIWVSVFLLLMASGATRANYIAPAYTVLLAAGGVVVERLARDRPWLPPVVAGAFAVGGAAVAPMAVDLLPPQQYIAYQHAIGLSAPKDQVDALGALPIHFALKFHGPAVLDAVSEAYAVLTVEDRARVGVMTKTFGEAGAINFFGRARHLPHAIGTHNNYWLWGPGNYSGAVMITVGYSEFELRKLFDVVELGSRIDCAYCLPALTANPVYICRSPRRPLAEMWPQLKEYI
jgi:hypothetical protein